MRTGFHKLLVVLVTILLSGCGGENKPTAPALSSGAWLAGWITSGLSSLRAVVEVLRVGQGPAPPVATVSCYGHFAVPLPPGRYVVEAAVQASPIYLSPIGPTLNPSLAETLTVPETPVDTIRADFVFGAIAINLKVPQELNGQFLDIEADWIRPDGTLDRQDEMLSGSGEVASDRYSCTLTGMPAGRYLLRFEQPISLFCPGVNDPAKADTIQVGTRGLAADYNATLQLPVAWIQGQVLGSAQIWGGEVQVAAFGPDSVEIGSGQSDLEGNFTVEVLGASQARLLLSTGNGSCWLGGQGFADATRFTLTSGDTTHVPPWSGGALRVHLDCEGVLEPVQMTLHFVDFAGVSINNLHFIGGDAMMVGPLNPGFYRVQVQPLETGTDFFLSQWYDGVDQIEDATPIQVTGPGTIDDVTIHLVRGGEIRGDLIGSQGQRIYGSLILTPAHQQVAWGIVDWISDDAFRVRGIPDGDYKLGGISGFIGAYTQGLPVRWYNGTADWDSATVITIRDHAIVSGIEVRVP